jgi:hypothetical protein
MVRQGVNGKVTSAYISSIWETAPSQSILNILDKFCGIIDLTKYAKFHIDGSTVLWSTGASKLPVPPRKLTLTVAHVLSAAALARD